MNYSDYIDKINELTRPLPQTPGWIDYWQARIAQEWKRLAHAAL